MIDLLATFFFVTFFEQPLVFERQMEVMHEAPVTAYSEIDSCHYENCAMASGKRAYIGALACPRDIKLGTKVSINGKSFTCEDRTNKDLDGRFDIFMGYGKEAYDKAWDFELQYLTIYIYE